MRKADYAALAAIIHHEWKNTEPARNFSDECRAAEQSARMQLLRSIARQFAASASVNKAEFLRACGIDP